MLKFLKKKKNLVLETSSITYNKINSTIDSSNKSKLTDNSKNIYDVDSFLYEIDKDLHIIGSKHLRKDFGWSMTALTCLS